MRSRSCVERFVGRLLRAMPRPHGNALAPLPTPALHLQRDAPLLASCVRLIPACHIALVDALLGAVLAELQTQQQGRGLDVGRFWTSSSVLVLREDTSWLKTDITQPQSDAPLQAHPSARDQSRRPR